MVAESKQVICLNTLKIYGSIRQASQALNVSHAYLSTKLKRGNAICKNLAFEYYSHDRRAEYKEKQADAIEKSKAALHKGKVICLNNLKVYASASAASRELNLSTGDMSSHLRGHYHSIAGYMFRRYDPSKMSEYKKINKLINNMGFNAYRLSLIEYKTDKTLATPRNQLKPLNYNGQRYD